MTRSPASPLPPPKARRRLRESAALTQAQLAARVGVTRDTVRAWESGRGTPRGRKREAYAKLLNTLAEEAAARRARPSLTPEPGTAQSSVPVFVAVGAGTPGTADRAPDSLVLPTEPLGERGRREQDEPTEQEASAGEERPEGAEGAEGAEEAEEAEGAERAEGSRERGEPAGRGESAGRGETPRRDAPSEQSERRPEAEEHPDAPTRPHSGPSAGEAAGEAASAPGALTPAQAFDALYEFGAPALVRQTYLLTGRRELARESVERAFQIAWENWPEVARDPDPAGWVRAAAYEYALSPWHRFRLRHRHPEPPPADPGDRTLLNTLLRLPPPHRRTLLLYDGVGLDLPETAAETEASTPAAANRLMRAREALADRLPELADPQVLHRRLAELASAERLRAARPPTVRLGSERRARYLTRAAIAFTVALIGTTALTLRTAPTHYEPPVSPGETVRGVPPRVAPGSLSDEQLELRQKLRDQMQDGPERLTPLAE